MLKLTTSIAVTAAALMTLFAADASAATLTKKFALESTAAARLSTNTITMKQNIATITASRGSAVMLNPQPLPPRYDPLSAKALNPQPLPPRWNSVSGMLVNPTTAKALNPQPLPPRYDPLSAKALNPQPLPPRWNLAASSVAIQNYKFAR